MTEHRSFLDDPANTREAIMKATYRALCEHGYADLTIARIGDHFEKSKSLLYHHYDSKDELLLDFLEFVLEEFQDSVPEAEDRSATTHLDAIFDRIFAADLPEDRREFGKAMVELRAQAAHDDRYRDHFARHDRFFRARLADIVESGIEEGAFREVDADRVAAFLHTVIGGEMTHRATAESDDSQAVREEIERYVETTLLVEGSDE